MEDNPSSGVTGVYWDRVKFCWHTQVFYRGQTIHAGYFDDVEEAIKARNRIKKIYADTSIPPRPPNKFDTVSQI